MFIDLNKILTTISSMTPKVFYTNDSSTFDELEFTSPQLVDEQVLLQGSLFGLPEDNLMGFRGPHGIFFHAHHKISRDGKWFLIASLAGAFKVPVGLLDTSRPLGVVCIQGLDWQARESRIASLSQDWTPFGDSTWTSMKASSSPAGFKPISRTFVARGEHGVSRETWVLLPNMPESIKNDNGKALIECEGSFYILDDAQQADCALNGLATWVVPDSNGNFIFPKTL